MICDIECGVLVGTNAADPKCGRDDLSSRRLGAAIRPCAFSQCLQMIELRAGNFGFRWRPLARPWRIRKSSHNGSARVVCEIPASCYRPHSMKHLLILAAHKPPNEPA
jgi:hypothetical protein